MPWKKRLLRGNPVFVKVAADGTPDVDGRGRVEVLYKLSPGAKVYRASLQNLESTGDAADDRPIEFDTAVAPPSAAIPEDAVVIYTDGACTGNPGPMGIGAVVMAGGERLEISEYLGVGTNNIAELTAILRALESVPDELRERPVLVHSDSSYCIGLLSKNWKAKANTELVAELRALLREFRAPSFIKVKGHAGIPENERCDELATGAITSRR